MVTKRIKFISEESNHYNTIQEAMDDFLKFKTAQGMSELTLRDYNNTFERFMRKSNNEIKMDILKKELLEFLTLLSDASPAKFNRPYSNLNALFNWLVQQNIMEHNPLLSIGLKKKRDDGRIRCVEVDNIKALLNVIDLKTYSGLRDYNIILLMLDCGIRPCEAFRMEVDDIDFKSGLLTIRKENAKTRKCAGILERLINCIICSSVQ
ncbi:MAG: tyrosine-type recombinase/integrase [Ruminiclostridium sp.]